MSRSSRTEGELALFGGDPVRQIPLPYGRQSIDDDDIEAVVEVLRGAWLTTGPDVDAFEQAFAETVGAADAVCFSSGTAALHAAAHVAGIVPGDEVVTTPMTFCATSNAVLYCGGTPVFADVEEETLNLDVDLVAQRLTPATRAVAVVDYAGQPARLDELLDLAGAHGLTVIEDACHALGASLGDRPIGSISDLSVFSFHPVKHVAAGEGGMVAVRDPELATRLRVFRNHGITTDHRQREREGSWFYEMVELGFNYRLTDIQAALGRSQLAKLRESLSRRREIAARYDAALAALPLSPLSPRAGVGHAYHLYVVLLDLSALTTGRAEVFAALRAEGIGVNVHYIPVHFHPYYKDRFGLAAGTYPVAESAYERMLTLPLFPAMTDDDVDDVVHAVRKVLAAFTA